MNNHSSPSALGVSALRGHGHRTQGLHWRLRIGAGFHHEITLFLSVKAGPFYFERRRSKQPESIGSIHTLSSLAQPPVHQDSEPRPLPLWPLPLVHQDSEPRPLWPRPQSIRPLSHARSLSGLVPRSIRTLSHAHSLSGPAPGPSGLVRCVCSSNNPWSSLLPS